MAFLEKNFTLNLLVCVTYVSFMFPQATLRVQRAKSAADWHGTRDWHDTISWRYHIQHSGHYKGLSVHRNADQTTLDLPGNLDKKDLNYHNMEGKITNFLHSPPLLIDTCTHLCTFLPDPFKLIYFIRVGNQAFQSYKIMVRFILNLGCSLLSETDKRDWIFWTDLCHPFCDFCVF